MKRFKIVLTLLVFAVGVSVAAQEKKYVSFDAKVVEKVSEQESSSISDPKDQAWAEKIIKNAFASYFADKSVGAEVYTKHYVDSLVNRNTMFADSLRQAKDKASELEKRLARTNESIDKLAGEKAAESMKIYNDGLDKIRADIRGQRDSLKKKDSLLKEKDSLLNANLTTIRHYESKVDALEKQVADLQKENVFAKKLIAVNEARQNSVDVIFSETKNSQTLEYIDPQAINEAIGDYEEHLSMIEMEMSAEMQEKVDYLKTAAQAGKFFKKAVSVLGAKYDKDKVEALSSECERVESECQGLNDGQRTVLAQIGAAIEDFPTSMRHFNNSILSFISSQGQIPDKETVEDVISGINLRINNFPGRSDSDDNHYNAYLTNLNKVLDMSREELRVMTEREFKEYIKKIEEAL